MTQDERAIRQLVEDWMSASRRGDVATVLTLMADDMLFLVPGQEPFGKEKFAAASKNMANLQIDGTAEVLELNVLGDWAYLRNYIEITITPQGGTLIHRSGYTLSILHKESGRWLLTRDANLVMARM